MNFIYSYLSNRKIKGVLNALVIAYQNKFDYCHYYNDENIDFFGEIPVYIAWVELHEGSIYKFNYRTPEDIASKFFKTTFFTAVFIDKKRVHLNIKNTPVILDKNDAASYTAAVEILIRR